MQESATDIKLLNGLRKVLRDPLFHSMDLQNKLNVINEYRKLGLNYDLIMMEINQAKNDTPIKMDDHNKQLIFQELQESYRNEVSKTINDPESPNFEDVKTLDRFRVLLRLDREQFNKLLNNLYMNPAVELSLTDDNNLLKTKKNNVSKSQVNLFISRIKAMLGNYLSKRGYKMDFQDLHNFRTLLDINDINEFNKVLKTLWLESVRSDPPFPMLYGNILFYVSKITSIRKITAMLTYIFKLGKKDPILNSEEISEISKFFGISEKHITEILKQLDWDIINDDMIDTMDARNILIEFLNDIDPILDNEMRTFGRDTPIVMDLISLEDDIEDYDDMLVDVIQNDQKLPIPEVEFKKMITQWQMRFRQILELRKAMGKRCTNTHTPIYAIPVDELGDYEFIRLTNGICWDSEELIEYIKAKNGRNDTSDLRDYPSKKIWENDRDFEQIINIPKGIDSGFSEWLKSIISTKLADKINDKTLHLMYIAASLLASEGNPFRQALIKHLSVEPKLLNVWTTIGGDVGSIRDIKDKEIRHQISKIVNNVLKSNAIAEFRHYYLSLNEDESVALLTFDPDLEKMIEGCYAGKECVFGMSNTLISLRNQIARIKKIPIIDLNND